MVGLAATSHGYGLTESGTSSGRLLESSVRVISNAECADVVRHNVSDHKIRKSRIQQQVWIYIYRALTCSTLNQ